MLYAVPNYEFFDRGSDAVVETDLDIPGALLADNCSRPADWKQVSGGKPEVRPYIEKRSSTRFQISNSLVYRDLPKPLQGGFKLTFEAAHTNFQRYLIVALTDAEGKHGYGVGWDSVRSDIAGGTGFARILLFDEAKPLAWNTTGKILANKPSGHPALEDGNLARFELTLRDGVLTLKVDGKVIATAKDQKFGNFSRIYLRGNQSQFLDNIVVAP